MKDPRHSIQKIEQFQTTDGEIFDTENAAIGHQMKLNQSYEVDSILDGDEDLTSNDRVLIRDFIEEHWDELKDVFAV